MTDQEAEIQKALKAADLKRIRGDSLLKRGQRIEAIAEFRAAEGIWAEQRVNMEQAWNGLQRLRPADLGEPDRAMLMLLVEAFGSKGGILRRVDDLPGALHSYRQGGELESRFELQDTYNRLNAIKCSLLTGDTTLRDLESSVREVARVIDHHLNNDQKFSDKSWPWADLGDCWTLLGDVEKAEKAYSVYIEKAQIKSPETTLAVLEQIAAKLQESADPGAQIVTAAIAFLRSRLRAR